MKTEALMESRVEKEMMMRELDDLSKKCTKLLVENG